MVIFPGSKINIGLNITTKRSDGYHDLESIFFPIPLSDILEINKDSVMAKDILDLDNYIPVKEILNLEVGEIYYSGGMGADVERIS
jgi:4-diphosphocytidyl-2C-methyl-D-erythritol kinase